MITTQSLQHNMTDHIISPTKDSSQLPNDLLEAISIYTDKRKKPKRNRSAFILFSIDVRKKHQSEDLDELNPNDKFVKIAQLWKEISEDERRVYENRAKEEKERYTTELNDFCRIFPTEPIQRPRNHIKKPCNAYGYFLKDVKESIRKDNPDLRMCEVLRIVGERWKILSPEDKEKFEKKAEISRKNFKEEVSRQMVQPVKKVKLQNGESAVKREKERSPQQNLQENLVCKDLFMHSPENQPKVEKNFLFEPSLRRSTSTDKKNLLANSILSNTGKQNQEFIHTSPIISTPTLQSEALNNLISIPSFQTDLIKNPAMAFALEGLYWKVERLRQQILFQINTVSSGGQAQPIYFDGYPLFGQEQSHYSESHSEGAEKKEEI